MTANFILAMERAESSRERADAAMARALDAVEALNLRRVETMNEQRAAMLLPGWFRPFPDPVTDFIVWLDATLDRIEKGEP